MTKLNGVAVGTVIVAMGLQLAGSAQATDAAENGRAISQEVGVTVSDYEYKEPGLMSLEAVKLGLEYSLKVPISTGWFVKGDFRYANGRADYESNGSGKSDDHTDWYQEWRLLAGYDFTFGDHTVGPYSGLGYRHLYNDGRGLTTTGHVGYQRESQYVYLPIGVVHRVKFGERSKLTTTLEYDYLIRGRQKSEFSDLEDYGWLYFENHTNKQRHGYGLRASVMYQFGSFSVGPYAHYWHIKDSERDTGLAVDGSGTVWLVTSTEPENKTRELGLKAAFNF